MVSTRIAHYEIIGKLGEGGMGVVYKAHDTHLDRLVALKVLPRDRVADPERRRRFIQEAKAASALHSANIVTIHDVTQSDGIDYIVMELVEGKTLSELIPRKGMRLAEALKTATQMAGALAAAHNKGIIHRDLKPANVMVTPDGVVKILDFGLAKLNEPAVTSPDAETRTIRTATEEGIIVGTVAYMSPEQAEGRAVDARSDIFSFGSVLYEMVTGRQAFQGDTKLSAMAAIVSQEPAPLGNGVPHELQRIVSRCLRKDPGHRFQHMDDVKVELEELQGEVEAGKVNSDLPRETQRPKKWRWLLAPLLAVLAGILIGAWLFSGPDIDVSRHRYTPIATVMHQRRIEEAGGIGAQMPAWSPDGKSIVYSADGLRLQRIDSPESSRLTDKGVHPFFSPDGTRIYYVTSGQTSRELWSVSVAGGTPELVLPALGGVPGMSGAAMSLDGRALAVVRPRKTGIEEMSVWISSPPGTPPRAYPGSPGWSRLSRAWLRFSPDGSKLLVTLAVGGEKPVEWWLLKWPPPATEQAGAIRRIFENGPRGGLGFAGDWLRDNRHLVVAVPQEGELGGPLWIADTVSETWRRITPGPVAHLPPRVSREGRVLVGILRNDESAIEIPLDGAAIRPLIGGFRQERYPAWSPAGEQMLYVTNERGEPEIWLASRKEGRQRPIVSQRDFPPGDGLHQFISPVFSPDGSRIVYGSRQAIWISPVAGGAAVRICEGWSAAWSPDGASLAVATHPRISATELIKVPVGRPQDAVVIHRALGAWPLRWSPDGRWITIQTADGFGVISPDGTRIKVLRKGELDWGAACGWSRDGSSLYLAYLTQQGRVLSAFNVDTGIERRVRDLGPLHFSYFALSVTGLSPSPDGKSLAASTWNIRFEPWILDGLEPPRTFGGWLLRPW